MNGPTAPIRPLVLIPSYNTGRRLVETVREALAFWSPIWVVIDGSTDGSEVALQALAADDPRIRVLRRSRNGGKGAAVADGVTAALAAGFTHALTMDADGQHPARLIPDFMALAARHPDAMVLGRPVFGPEAPAARRQGRKLTIAMVRCEILGGGIDDPLFGFRVYPLAPLDQALRATRWARGFDFDQEVIVRMYWAGTPALNVPAPCRYLSRAEGGVSHFHYGRDNVLLVWLQLRLLGELLLWRWPAVWRLRRRRRAGLGLAVALLCAAALTTPAGGAALPADPDPFLTATDPFWARLFEALALHGDRSCAFTERRYFPFRTRPVVLTGRVRITPDHGVSLEYLSPQPRILIVDRAGMLMRTAAGHDISAPDDPRVRAGAAAMVAVLRFDRPQLETQYALHGSRQGESWRLSLLPRTGQAETAPFAAVVVEGTGTIPGKIELIRTVSQRVVVDLSEPRSNAPFSAAELARYFRR